MKFVYSILLFFLVFTPPVRGQIPNYSFENWTTFGSYEIPDQWGTLNDLTAPSSVYTATRGTPGNPGNSYLQVTSRATSTGAIPGIVVSGLLDTVTMQPKSGIAFAQRPQELTGNWQYMSFSGSPGSIKITFTRWDSINGQREIVASAFQSLPGMVMSWSYFSININYLTGNMPDTCLIVLEASGPVPSDNDYLWVDNLSFNGNVIGISDQAMVANRVALWPNPATESTVITIYEYQFSEVVISLYDESGRKVQDVLTGSLPEGTNSISLNTFVLRNGIYFIEVCGENEVSYIKLIVSH